MSRTERQETRTTALIDRDVRDAVGVDDTEGNVNSRSGGSRASRPRLRLRLRLRLLPPRRRPQARANAHRSEMRERIHAEMIK